MVVMQLATLSQFYQKVRAVAPALNSNQQLRLILGQTELREDSTTLQAAGIVHAATVFAVIRTVGGSDPRVQMLQGCLVKTIYGVTTPSTRACVHCGALVQHTEACKQMKCLACSGEFCFICLRRRTPEGTNVAIVSLPPGKQTFQVLVRRYVQYIYICS